MFPSENIFDVEDNSDRVITLARELFIDAIEKAKPKDITINGCSTGIDRCFTIAEIFYLRAERLCITNLDAFKETEKENGTTEEV